MGFKGSQYIWKDRKRYFGIPMSFTRYAMSDDRLFQSIGLLNIRDEEVLLYRIRDINTSRTLWQRLFGVGTITVASSDKSMPVLLLKNIKDPMRIKELLHQQVENMKIQRRVHLNELMSGNGCNHEDDLDEDFDTEDI